ncbi:MAG: TMEM175 family protein [Bacteroidota bacterium]
MVRQSLKNSKIGLNQDFRYRGEEQTRIETFSDAVFALAITLLIFSSKVPDNFEELRGFLFEIIPFGLSMILITYIWYEHYLYFIRFGFKSSRIVILNTALLFSILLYVYPLKFLFKVLVSMYGSIFAKLFGIVFDSPPAFTTMISTKDAPELMLIYGIGAAFIFLIIVLMYRYALSKTKELGLNEIEIFDTKSSLQSAVIMSSIPVLSVLIVLIFGNFIIGVMLSGFVYMLYPFIYWIWGRKRNKMRKSLVKK